MRTIQKTMIPALPAKMHQHKDKPITSPAICRFLLQILFHLILLLAMPWLMNAEKNGYD